MTDYDPAIPAAADILSQSQADIQNNFNELDTIMGYDHYKWSDSTAAGAYRGLHRYIQFPEVQPSSPSLGAMKGIFFTKGDVRDTSARAQLYWRNVNHTYQITNRFYNNAAKGYYAMPLATGTIPGPIIMWGQVAASLFTNSSTGSTYTLTFPSIANFTGSPTGFPTNLWNIQLTVGAADVSGKTASIGGASSTGCQIYCSTNKTNFDYVNWIAWGN